MRLGPLLLGTLLSLSLALGAESDSGRGALDELLGTPDWLSIAGEYRLRYEHLANPFRPSASGSEQLLAERISLAVTVDGGGNFHGRAELLDSRAWLDDAGSPLGTDDVNALEPLEAWLGWRMSPRSLGGELDLRAGRMALNLGSRRFVSRNGFRNTINAFTAVRARWRADGGRLFDFFYALPHARRPTAREALDDNVAQLDDESLDRRFYGLHLTQPLDSKIFDSLELYALRPDEQDAGVASGVQTRNRHLTTGALRLLRPACAWKRAGGDAMAGFLRRGPLAPKEGATRYGYLQLTATF